MKRPQLTVYLLALVAAGCAAGSGVQYSDPRADAAGKTFAVSPGKGNIYVYRAQVYMGETPLEVFLDERWTGKTLGQTYFMVEVDTGMHTLRAKGDAPSTLECYVAPGQNVFVSVQISPGVTSVKGAFVLKDDAQGMTGVRECRRIEAID